MEIEELLEVAAPWQLLGAPALAVGLLEITGGRTRKRPLTQHGHLDAVLERDELAHQLGEGVRRLDDGEELGVGIVAGAGGRIILDFDAGPGKEGLIVLEELLGVYPGLDACSYTSISGGINVVLVKADDSEEIGNHSPWTARGVDVRGDAGWIVPPGVATSWGTWAWRSGFSPDAATVVPAGIAEQLRPPGHLGSTPASAAEVDAWLDAGGTVFDEIDRHWLAAALERFAAADQRNPTMFELLDELVARWGYAPGTFDRRRAYTVLERAWVERLVHDGEQHRVEEIAGILARKVGYYEARRAAEQAEADDDDGEADDEDPAFERDVAARARLLRVDEKAKAVNHSRKIAALGKFEQPIIGLEAVREHLEAAGARCFWGTGDVILLARGETLMLAGREGVGKTTIAQQVVRAALGADWKVLGHRVDVLGDDEIVLYLALDRPRQIQEALTLVLANEPGTERLVLWTHGLMRHVAAGRDAFLEWLAGVVPTGLRLGLVVVDSLKDVIPRLSSDEDAGRWQQIRSALASLGVPVIELHHFKKDDGGKGNDVLFGSALLAAGAGSVLQIHGEATDETYLIQHTKTPAVPQEPLKIRHSRDELTGWVTEILGTPRDDYETAMVAAGEAGFTTVEIVRDVNDGRSTDARKKAVQREVARLLEAGRITDTGLTRGNPKRPAKVYIWATFAPTGDAPADNQCPQQEETPTRGDDDDSDQGTSPRPLGQAATGPPSPDAAEPASGDTAGDDPSEDIGDAFRRAEEGDDDAD